MIHDTSVIPYDNFEPVSDSKNCPAY
jgi:hypothetical protein